MLINKFKFRPDVQVRNCVQLGVFLCVHCARPGAPLLCVLQRGLSLPSSVPRPLCTCCQAYHLGGMGCSIGVVALGLVKDMLAVRGQRARVCTASGNTQFEPSVPCACACCLDTCAAVRSCVYVAHAGTHTPRTCMLTLAGAVHASSACRCASHQPARAAPCKQTPQAHPNSVALFVPCEVTTYCYYPGYNKVRHAAAMQLLHAMQLPCSSSMPCSPPPHAGPLPPHAGPPRESRSSSCAP